ncbi:MAG TPA: Fic family protein [Candidatus Dormibacteraeota bacterium]|nr:Fic family protein [Candidatus Dormibacteraeota bacterium]
MPDYIEIEGTPYCVTAQFAEQASLIAARVRDLRAKGALDAEALKQIYRYFRIKNIYNSNAIEGNTLDVGETRLVVEQGLTITGKPLRDQAEAKNLSAALDLLEDLATSDTRGITESDIRQLHMLILKNINDENAGRYRTVPVEISGSQHRPPDPIRISQEMAAFSQWLNVASLPGDRLLSADGLMFALVAHTWFVTIHPFVDGNGRSARLLLNLILMRYGFPIAIITREDRLRYYDALEEAQSTSLTAFGELVLECEQESIEEYETAVAEQQQRGDWTRLVAARFSADELVRTENGYEVWKSAMELLRSYFRQTTEMINRAAPLGHVYFNDFGMLEFQKYLSLMKGESAKRTWLFRIDFVQGAINGTPRSARYLFFFGSPSVQLRARQCGVTVFVAREEPAGSFNYARLEQISAPNVPDLVELGYEARNEAFVVRYGSGQISDGKLEDIGRTFIEQVIAKHYS